MKNIIPKKELDTLFFGLEDILVCNQIFLVKLRKRIESWSVNSQLGDLFTELVRFYCHPPPPLSSREFTFFPFNVLVRRART